MPSMKQSAGVDMQGWEPVTESAKPSAPPPAPEITNTKNPTMLASMPLMASTGDAFQRQFYGGANVPSYRILPARREGGA